MLTRKQLFLIVGLVVAFAIVAFAVSWAGSSVHLAWFDGGTIMGKCLGSTSVCTGV